MLLISTEKPLFDAAVGGSRIYVNHFIVAYVHLHWRHIHYRWTLFGGRHLVCGRFNHYR